MSRFTRLARTRDNSPSGIAGNRSNSTTAMTDNNGNLKQEIDVPGVDGFSVQWFTYDALNRLQAANETRHVNSTNQDSDVWKQTYVYDRYGNRTINTNASVTYGVVNNLGFEVETGTNRLYAPGDLALSEASRRMRYDAAERKRNWGSGLRSCDFPRIS